ncbi:MAG: hypothetical protein HY053_07805 [Proteobacteria bacterium]|nr:hypothetical protein [Pseudomonadota bacterium]
MDLELETCGVAEVLNRLRGAERDGRPFDVVISFEDPGTQSAPRLEKALGRKWKGRQLILECYNINMPGPGRELPPRSVVKDAIEFMERQPGKDGKLRALVHCDGGLGRSPALAYVLWCYARGLGSESAGIDEILRLNPAAEVNRPIVAYGDLLLERDGKMLMIYEDARIRRNRRITVQFGL